MLDASSLQTLRTARDKASSCGRWLGGSRWCRGRAGLGRAFCLGLARAAMAVMRPAGYGRIILVASTGGLHGDIGL